MKTTLTPSTVANRLKVRRYDLAAWRDHSGMSPYGPLQHHRVDGQVRYMEKDVAAVKAAKDAHDAEVASRRQSMFSRGNRTQVNSAAKQRRSARAARRAEKAAQEAQEAKIRAAKELPTDGLVERQRDESEPSTILPATAQMVEPKDEKDPGPNFLSRMTNRFGFLGGKKGKERTSPIIDPRVSRQNTAMERKDRG